MRRVSRARRGLPGLGSNSGRLWGRLIFCRPKLERQRPPSNSTSSEHARVEVAGGIDVVAHREHEVVDPFNLMPWFIRTTPYDLRVLFEALVEQ